MSSSFSRPSSFSCLVFACLLFLNGCATWDYIIGNKPAAQPDKQPKIVMAQKQAPTKSAATAASRLDQQPWPPGMGQPWPQKNSAAQQAVVTQALPPAAASSAAPTAAMSPNIKVAILLPLSGKQASLGQAMLNAAQLAVFDASAQNFELMPRDTGATAESAKAAARDALESGAQLLIGPLFAGDVTAVKPVVKETNISMLALSTDVSLAESGSFVMGFAPAPQVDRVVSYAAQQGARRFAAVIPSGPYGALIKKAFEKAVQQEGGAIITQESPARLPALLAKKDQIEALLLPLSGSELQQVVGQLAAGGLDRTKVKLLGTGLWDESGLGHSMNFLVGGWYAASEPDARAAFKETYKKTYNSEPPRLATLAYDATALAAVLAQRGGRFDRAALTNSSGFAGLDGIFRLTLQGQAERGLAVNEITSAGSKIIDPAPSTFVGMDH